MPVHKVLTGTPHRTPSGQKGALTWAQARQVAFDCATGLSSENVPLADATGCTVTADVVAPRDLPHYASSAMDGWAVKGAGPWTVVQRDPRQDRQLPLSQGQACVIATGGLVPDGATAVVRKEGGQVAEDVDGGGLRLMLKHDAMPGEGSPGRHIRPAGEEARAGDLLIPAHTLLSPAHVALAAVAGYDELPVRRKPLLAVILTGSEVLPTGEPAAGQVRDALGPQLAHVISQLGGLPGRHIRIGDSYDAWLSALTSQHDDQRPDVIVTTGGTGPSATDHFRAAVATLGGRLLIDGIAMRPGHPAVLAELPGNGFVIGLPGNPLAAMMALITIGEPLLAALANRPMRRTSPLPSAVGFAAAPEQTRLVPCTVSPGAVSPTAHIGPGMVRGLALAHAVMVVPPTGVQPGAPVPVLPLPWARLQTADSEIREYGKGSAHGTHDSTP